MTAWFLPNVSHAAEDDEEVVVEGDPLAASGGSVTAIPVDDRLPPTADVGDAVARAPGTTVRRLGGLGEFSAVSLRGSGLRQVEVQVDGVPLNPDGSAAVDLGSLPLRAFSSIEVWRGAGPPWTASAPVGGVVNLVTASEPDSPLSIQASGGSWGSALGQVSGAWVGRKVEVLGGAHLLRTSGNFWYLDDLGTNGVLIDDRLRRRTDNDKSVATGLLRVRSSSGAWRWTGLLVGALREEGLPGPVGGAPYGRFATAWGLASTEGAVRYRSGSLRLRAWAQGRDERLSPPGGALSLEQQGQVALEAVDRRAFRGVGLGWIGRFRLEGRAGSPAATRATLATGGDLALRPHPNVGVSAVIMGQVLRDWRADVESTRALLTPRGNLAWTPRPGTTLHLASGRSWRPPDFLELFGDRGPLQGRPDLAPERGWFLDVGVREGAARRGAEGAVFVNRLVDRIVFVQNGQRSLVPVNIARSHAWGAELAGWIQAPRLLDARGQVSLTETRQQSDTPGQDGKRLPRVPLLSTVADVGLRWETIARVALSADLVSGNAWDEANLSFAAPRVLVGAIASTRPGPKWPQVSLEVRNLANQIVQATPRDYASPESGRALRPLTDFAGYPLPGRTALLTVRWSPGD